MTQPTNMQVDGNDNGAAYTVALNEILMANTTFFAGNSAPTSPVANMWWQDTSVDPPVVWRRNATNSAWVRMGSFDNNTYSGSCTGSSGSTTKLTTARAIAVQGDITGSASFDGSANAVITATLANSGVTAGSYGSVTKVPVLSIDGKGRVTSASTATLPSTFVTSFNGRTGGVSLQSSDVFNVLPDEVGNGGKVLGLSTSETGLEWKYAILNPRFEHRNVADNTLLTPPLNETNPGLDRWQYLASRDIAALEYVAGTPRIVFTKYYQLYEPS